jgi:hypothetical protein
MQHPPSTEILGIKAPYVLILIVKEEEVTGRREEGWQNGAHLGQVELSEE